MDLAKIQNNLHFHCLIGLFTGSFWIVMDAKFPHLDNEDLDQTAQMCRLIWVFIRCTYQKVCFLMLRLILCALREYFPYHIYKQLPRAVFTFIVWSGPSLPDHWVEGIGYCRIHCCWTGRTLMALCGCTGWSKPAMFALGIRDIRHDSIQVEYRGVHFSGLSTKTYVVGTH